MKAHRNSLGVAAVALAVAWAGAGAGAWAQAGGGAAGGGAGASAGGSAAGAGAAGSTGAAAGTSGTLSPSPGVAPSTENLPGLTPPPAPGTVVPETSAGTAAGQSASLGAPANVPAPLPTTTYGQNTTSTVLPNGTSCPVAGVASNAPVTQSPAGGSLTTRAAEATPDTLGPSSLPGASPSNATAGIGAPCPPAAENAVPPVTARTQPGTATLPGTEPSALPPPG